MYILDSLSLTRAAADKPIKTKATKQQQTTLRTTSSSSSITTTTATTTSVFKKPENVIKNLMSIKVTVTSESESETTSIANDLLYEMTTNKYKQLQQQQHQDSQQQQQQNNVIAKFIKPKNSSSTLSPTPPTEPPESKIPEMIKNNNENLNDDDDDDELAKTTIENNTTITDNTMPQEELQEQQQQNNESNYNRNNENNSSATEWGKVPATYNCSNTNTTNSTTIINHQTIENNATKTIAADTITSTSTTITIPTLSTTFEAAFKALESENTVGNNVRVTEVKENGKMLTNIQNNVNLNTFVLPSAAAATTIAAITLQNVNSCSKSPSSCYNSQLCMGMRDVDQSKETPIGNLMDSNQLSIDSPVDSVLEDFEKFLNSVKLENQTLSQCVPECNDLIDLSDDLRSSQENVISDDKCNKLAHDETSLNALLNIKTENYSNSAKTEDGIHVNNILKQNNFENLLYCDLNETLEEQNLLESKEILQELTRESKAEQLKQVVEEEEEDRAKIIKTLKKMNEIKRDDKPIPLHDSNINKILMVDGENGETTNTKTPVTCRNVYSNDNSNININSSSNETHKNNSKEQHESCAVVIPKETCQNRNSCKVRTLTATTTTNGVTLENIIKIRSSSSIENISPQTTQNNIQNSHNHCQRLNANKTAAIAVSEGKASTAKAFSISCCTDTNTDTNTPTDFDFGEYKRQKQQQQQQHEVGIQQDQFTSAYELRDFAKCLKPSADEDIEYTLNFTKIQNEKEKLQKFNSNFIKNAETDKNLTIITSAIKLKENCVLSENLDENLNCNGKSEAISKENNLYNKIFTPLKCNFKADNGLSQSQTLFKNNFSNETPINCSNFIENPEIVKFKDTQFLEIENLSTPKFFKQSPTRTDAQKFKEKESEEFQEIPEFFYKNSNNSKSDIEINEVFEKDLNFDCNEKIYTREKNSQPSLLYLTFVWPTKNEGQVVTTRRQGNDVHQGENEIDFEKEQEQENSKAKEKAKAELENKLNRHFPTNKNVDDDVCECNCKLARGNLLKTYGTCNKNHVEFEQNGRTLNEIEKRFKKKVKTEKDNHDNDDEQKILKDKQDKNQFSNKTDANKNSENINNFLKNQENLKSLSDFENNKIPESLEKNSQKISLINESVLKSSENFYTKSVSNEKCVLCKENREHINCEAKSVENEKNLQIKKINKSVAIDINRNNPNLNKTESVYNQDNVKKDILNLNKGLKRLSETNQNINNNHQQQRQQQHETPNYPCQQQEQQQLHNNQWLLKTKDQVVAKSKELEEEEEQLNLEEFEASQRLKRLLQQQQQFRTRYDTIPTQFDNYKQQTNAIPTVTTTTTTATATATTETLTPLKESLKTEIARHSTDTLKGNLFIPLKQKQQQKEEEEEEEGWVNTNNPQGVEQEEATTTTTLATKANKLQADYETSLERSSLLTANEHQYQYYHQHQHQQQQTIIEINRNPKEQKDISSYPNKNGQVDLNEKDLTKEKEDEKNKNPKDIEKQEIGNRDLKVSKNKELKVDEQNSPHSYVSRKIVRLSQQKYQQQQQHQTPNQKSLLFLANPLAELDLTHNKQEEQEPETEKIIIENSSNLRFPLVNINNKTEISSPSKLCNLNLQHIVKTKQLVLQQEQQQYQKDQKENLTKDSGSPTPAPPVPTSSSTEPTLSETFSFEPQLNEYKSAFVPTKPEVYKTIKPLTATTKSLTAPIPLVPATVTLSEFDTQRFSDFLYLNYITNSLNENNNNNNNNYNPSNDLLKRHVLPIQQEYQQQQLQQLPYPFYATTNLVDPLNLPYCYDELLNLNDSQHVNSNNALAAQLLNPRETTNVSDNIDNETPEDDLVSISSTNSSPCDCINCQQQTQETELQLERVRDRLYIVDPNNVIPLVSLQNPNESVFQTKSNELNKMREVNGQLRGLLKKPNRPPPTRKNRVVFDETRNEFFEADYIILIREDCAYDEEDEEPCTCGEHELVRLCCEEGCQCNYSTAPATTDDNRTPQSPKFAPPIEFVDEAALSPPDGYKDNGLKNTLGGALSGHIFGAQHLQQLQVIQRLQQQRAAMLAARNNSQIPPPPPPATGNPPSAASVNQQQQQQLQQSSATVSSAASPLTSSSSSSSTPSSTAAAVATSVVSNNGMNQSGATQQQQLQQHSPDDDTQGVCTECAECAECAAKQLQQDAECNSPQCQEELTAPLGVPAVALLPIHTSSPERRMTQKEIIAGEERPRYVLQAQYKSSPVSERRIVREATEDLAANAVIGSPATSASIAAVATATTLNAAGGSDSDLIPPALPAKPGATSLNHDLSDSEKPPPIPPKESSPTTQISGILKGGKLWKQDSISQSDDQNNTTSEDEAGSTSNGTLKRSVRFVTEEIGNDEVDGQSSNVEEDNQINELIPIKKHSTLFKNALRPNSAVQQLFPSTVSHQTLTSEALRAFDESKRAGCLVSTLPGSAGDSDTLRRSMERNILRRSLIKKKAVKSDISLEERIKQLTCGIDEDNDESALENGDDDNSKIEDSSELSHRDSPAGEENPQKFNANGNNSDKSFSPNSSVSSSSSGSSAYKKITEIFNRDKKNQEKIMEMEENPIVIIPQECRCPAAPDLGMGVQVPVVHTQIHRTPPRQTEPKRQFLSTLAPLTACVAGNKDDLSSYYTLAAAHHNQAAQNVHAAEYNLAAMMAGEQNPAGIPQSTGDEVRKVAPDVIAGTPGQEQQDELAAFAQQEANRTDKIKKRYGNEQTNTKEPNSKEVNSDDDEGNDYGFNKRPSVRGIKPKFSSTNEILQQMQDQLSQQMPSVAHSQPLPQPMKSYTLPKQSSTSAMTKQLSQQQPSPQNVPHPIVATSQQQLPQQQQMCNAVAAQPAMQMPANAAISQQQTEQRTWSFYSETGGAGEQQRLPVESAAAAMQQTYYQTLPAGAMFRHTMIHQQQHGPEEAMLYAQNCQAMATTIEPQPHYGHYARSPTRRPESPPPLRNYHQTMVLIPYNAETYSQFAATNMDPKVAHIQRQNILEYQQVTQQTIRVPIGYALPGMQLHVVAGRGHAAQYATAAAAQTHHHQHQRIMTQRYQFAQEASMAGFSERGVPEGAAAVSHSDCSSSGMVSPTTGQQIAMQQQQQLQQGNQMVQQQQQHQQQQQQVNCQQQQQQQQQPQPQTQNNMQSAAQGSVYYAMNV